MESVCLLVSIQERNYAVVLDVLTGFSIGKKDKDSMQAGVEALSTDELDSLMKYIYRGFARPTENSCEKLLNWHEAVSGSQLFGVPTKHTNYFYLRRLQLVA